MLLYYLFYVKCGKAICPKTVFNRLLVSQWDIMLKITNNDV